MKLMLCAVLIALVTPVNSAPEAEIAIVLTRSELQKRHAIEAQYIHLFLHTDDREIAAYFAGRKAVYTELLYMLERHELRQ